MHLVLEAAILTDEGVTVALADTVTVALINDICNLLLNRLWRSLTDFTIEIRVKVTLAEVD